MLWIHVEVGRYRDERLTLRCSSNFGCERVQVSSRNRQRWASRDVDRRHTLRLLPTGFKRCMLATVYKRCDVCSVTSGEAEVAGRLVAAVAHNKGCV